MRCPHCGKNIAIPETAAPLLDDSQMRAVASVSHEWLRRLERTERALVVLQNEAADSAKQIAELRHENKDLARLCDLLLERTAQEAAGG